MGTKFPGEFCGGFFGGSFGAFFLSGTGRIRFRGVRFQTPNSVSFFWLTELRGANSVSSSQPIIFLCAKADSPSFSQNSPSLPQNSVSSLFRNSTLETVFRPFPILGKKEEKIHPKIHRTKPNQNLGVLRPKSTLQESGLDKLLRRSISSTAA